MMRRTFCLLLSAVLIVTGCGAIQPSSIADPTDTPWPVPIVTSTPSVYGRGESKVYLVKSDGSHFKEIGLGGLPEFSKDGHWLSFIEDIDDQRFLTLYDLSTGDRARFDIPQTFTEYAWSPDGTMISAIAHGNSQPSLILITPATQETRTATDLPVGADYMSLWSPDSRWIAVVSQLGGASTLSLVEAATGQQEVIDTGQWITLGGWSGDSQSVLWDDGPVPPYRRSTPGPGTEAPPITRLMITQAETQKSTQVMSWQGTVCDLLWLPQTSQIAFAGTIHSSCAFPIDDMQHGTVDQHPEQQVYRINPDGTELTQLSHTAGGAYDISLSPDGRMLGYVNANRRGTQSLYVFDLKDGVERSTKIAGMSYGVDWSPDSRWLFAVSEVIVKSDPVTFEEEELLIGVGGYTMGGWAPDGKRVFVRGYCCGVEFIFYIDITEPDTTHEFDQIEELHTPYNPVWSPDGEWIAYDAFPGCRFACP